MANTSGITETIHCKNGFYFGDPCYALKGDLYQEWINWGDERQKNTGRWCNDGKFIFEGKEIMVVDSTAYGDGCYPGTSMNYGVDAGCLAVIPLEFCDMTKNMDGLVVKDYDGLVTLATDNACGQFMLTWNGQVEVVETGDTDEEEEEEDDIPW